MKYKLILDLKEEANTVINTFKISELATTSGVTDSATVTLRSFLNIDLSLNWSNKVAILLHPHSTGWFIIDVKKSIVFGKSS